MMYEYASGSVGWPSTRDAIEASRVLGVVALSRRFEKVQACRSNNAPEQPPPNGYTAPA